MSHYESSSCNVAVQTDGNLWARLSIACRRTMCWPGWESMSSACLTAAENIYSHFDQFPFRILPLAHFWIFGERLRLATASLGFRYPAQV
ncbi:hypothetical protein CGCA056_v000291 [Colletotrichum aenigma]|uniref:uncharacterized protein n=1 Tax=Colletotrichum aenigma TaxID=1215731 RepID=UPI001872E1C7|nr:uncharacterized protein CGCA056_v000291 [Colletotrichum aenigma]KAF5527847.1 hypothetical protein CGCA056_v000291 [Colletotrichum aenigma]